MEIRLCRICVVIAFVLLMLSGESIGRVLVALPFMAVGAWLSNRDEVQAWLNS